MEIERKYLVASLPSNLDSYPHVKIEQGYLCTSPTLRIRRMGDFFVLTVKEKVRSATSAIVNHILLKSKCDGNMVMKTRCRIPLGNYTAELDIFHGAHEGLLLVEVEFPSVEAANAFVPPAWFGDDVSGDPRYRNSYLAHNNL